MQPLSHALDTLAASPAVLLVPTQQSSRHSDLRAGEASAISLQHPKSEPPTDLSRKADSLPPSLTYLWYCCRSYIAATWFHRNRSPLPAVEH